MALVNVEVVCRTLVLSGGLTLQPGERFGLDLSNPEHVTIIERGWVRVCPPTSISPVTSVLEHPPNKQVRRRQTRRKKA
jgi:hypothetical protein